MIRLILKILHKIVYWLVVSTFSEKYQSVGIIIPNIWKNKKCSKPRSRILISDYNYQPLLTTINIDYPIINHY